MKLSIPLLALLTIHFGFNTEASENIAKSNLPLCCRSELEPVTPLADASIYQLGSNWKSDFGKPIKLRKLRGKPHVMVMFFANCEWACPILLHDLKRIENTLPEGIRDKVGFVLVSFDSERDTVEKLHAYREKHALSNSRWLLLRSGPDEVRELAAVLGINYRKGLDGQFVHSNTITILNSEGENIGQINGLNQKPTQAVELLKKTVDKGE